VARPQARTGGRTDLWNALTVAYERLAGAVISRSRSTAEDRQDEG
jgi:hypothetical protein